MEVSLNLPLALTSHLTHVAVLAATKAGELLRKGFGSNFQITSKSGKHNLVTEYDNLAENLIVDLILSHYPQHAILAEERGAQGSRENSVLWVIDPLDGTVNFAHNIPCFAVSIAACLDGEVLSSVIYQPLLDELFVAEKEHGAYLNNRKLAVTKTSDLTEAIAATGFPYNTYENPLHCIDHFAYMAKLGIPLRRMGSAALDLAYVAAGRFDAFWEVSLNPWDWAAGKLLVEEAGGRFTDFTGEPYSILEEGPILVSNGPLHHQLIDHFIHTYD